MLQWLLYLVPQLLECQDPLLVHEVTCTLVPSTLVQSLSHDPSPIPKGTGVASFWVALLHTVSLHFTLFQLTFP